jgi:hypothetical protein
MDSKDTHDEVQNDILMILLLGIPIAVVIGMSSALFHCCGA